MFVRVVPPGVRRCGGGWDRGARFGDPAYRNILRAEFSETGVSKRKNVAIGRVVVGVIALGGS